MDRENAKGHSWPWSDLRMISQIKRDKVRLDLRGWEEDPWRRLIYYVWLKNPKSLEMFICLTQVPLNEALIVD